MKANQIRIHHNEIVDTVYNDDNYQIFYNSKANSVYDKIADKIYDITINSWTKMVMKL